MPQSKINELLDAVATLTDSVLDLNHKIDALEVKVDATKDLVEKWETVKSGGRFLTAVARVTGKALIWLGKVAIGAGVLWAIFKSGMTAVVSMGGKP